eukprot:CAMPEP_0197869190 /NCGR_PEP_ID=MMETSP1439-20131203/22_1 /TAXON_ID=66791 /ORGANISM="Gonyaulax spinifera, Strain CCMP409" /LENGTH=64 /DNA_ID=CAMNT_0043487945 /DNA_START=116 /DNA_END=310 /DNA_ORIENTATION=+
MTAGLKVNHGFSTQQLPPGQNLEHLPTVSVIRQHLKPDVLQHLFVMQLLVVSAQSCILGSASIM